MTRDADIARIAAALDTVPVGDYPWHHEAPHHPEYAAALYDAGLRPSVEPLDVERLAEALKEYDAGRLRVPFAPSHVLSPDQSPSRFHRAWAKTLLDYAALLLVDTPSVEPREGRLAEIAESVLADLASRPAITTWATPDVKVGDWFRVVVVTADADKVIASLVSMDRPSVEPELDEAWKAAEAALPDGWDGPRMLPIGTRGSVSRWIASAIAHSAAARGNRAWIVDGSGPTPVEALRALAALLPTQASDSPEKP